MSDLIDLDDISSESPCSPEKPVELVTDESFEDTEEWYEFQKIIKTRLDINICILGTVSAGKTTFLNTLFTNTYGEMKIKRTTMCPQVYHETEKIDELIDPAVIRSRNKEINDKLYSKKDITLSDIKELIHFVPKIENFVKLNKGVYFSVYDVPGLNDANTKDVYFQYVKNSFHKFDIIVYVIDVKLGLNTSDEIDILNMIISQINFNQKRGLMQKLIVIVNKCDDFNEDEEIREMYKQVETTIANKTEGENIEYQIFPLSCEDAYMYRMINNNPDVKLDDKYYHKIGINEYGKKKWNLMGKDKIDNLRKEIKKGHIEPTVTEFNKITKYIADYFCGPDGKTRINQYLVLQNRIKHFWTNFLESVIDTCLLASEWNETTAQNLVSESYDEIITWLNYARILQRKYKFTETHAPIKALPLFTDYLKTYFDLYASNIDKFPSSCMEIIKEHLEVLLAKIGKHVSIDEEQFKLVIESFRIKINDYYALSFQVTTPNTIDDAKERLSILYKNGYQNMNECIVTYLVHGITNKKLNPDDEDINSILDIFQKDYEITNSQMTDILLEILPHIYQVLHNNYENNVIRLIYEYLPDIHKDCNQIDNYHDLRIYIKTLIRADRVVIKNPIEFKKIIAAARSKYSLKLERRLIQLLG